MIRRHWPALSIAAFVFALGLSIAAEPTAPAKTPAITPESGGVKELIAREQQLLQRYKSFTTNLLALAQKLEKSDRVEDKDKAKALRKAIELADKEGVDNKFTTLLRTLTKSANDIGLSDIASAKNQNDDLIKVLKEILAILQSDDELARIKAEKDHLERLLADLNSIIRGEKILDARANSNKGDPKQLAKDQDKLKNATANLADKMGADKKAGGKPGEANGDAKPGKPDDKDQGENKEDTDKPKADERANADKNDPMKGDGADSKPSKGGPPSEGKPSKGSPMDGAGSASKPMGEPMKPPMDNKTAQKPAENRNKQDNKGDQKGSASKSPPSDQQASNKGQGSPSDGTPSGSPKPGSSGSPPSGNPPPQGPKAPGADSVKKAIPDEESAAGNLDQDKRPKASEDINNAVDKLQVAREELEKRLKQLREQELERILANLEARVNKMLQMQIEVKGQTESIYAIVQKHPEKKAQPVDFQNAQKQEDKEAEIIGEADKAIQLLISEGSAVAFPAVFEEVRKDMARVKERLHDANVGEDTQSIEQDIIEALTHMRDALKKAQQELGKSPPPPPGSSPPSEPQLQKLLDQIAELKMIRELQKQVNGRTKRYGEKTPEAEQTDDKQIKKELKDLSDRQERIETMVNNLVTKKNQ
jgi:hypothetical protein